MSQKAHWDSIYATKPPETVSWYQRTPTRSLALIQRIAPGPEVPIVDIGGGTSTLVDALIDAGYTDLTVLDIAPSALTTSQRRLGDAATRVRWVEADVLSAGLPSSHYGVWHDRAVFHFLTEREDRASYVVRAKQATRRGGFIIIATFAGDGPTMCSGLPAERYSPETLQAEFDLELVASEREVHRTPGGVAQPFTYCVFSV